MTDLFRPLDDEREVQQAQLDRDLDPDMALVSDWLSGDLTEAENARLAERFQKDDGFRALAEPLLAVYRHDARRAATPPHVLDSKWHQLRQRIGLAPTASSVSDDAAERFRLDLERHKRALKRRALYAWAAMILFVAVLPQTGRIYHRIADLRYSTAIGETRRIPMTDGSEVTLAGGSRLVLDGDFSPTWRQVILTGEATFDVAPIRNGGAPFVVNTQSAVITVIGTVFTVHAYEGEPTLIDVKEGTVRVHLRDRHGETAGGPVFTLSAGQRGRAVRDHTLEIVR